MKYVFSQQEAGELVLAELYRRGVRGTARLTWNVGHNPVTGEATLEIAVEMVEPPPPPPPPAEGGNMDGGTR